MIKVSVMYPNTPGGRFDHDYYRDKHMPLVKARMGDACRSYTVDKGMAEKLNPILERMMAEAAETQTSPPTREPGQELHNSMTG